MKILRILLAVIVIYSFHLSSVNAGDFLDKTYHKAKTSLANGQIEEAYRDFLWIWMNYPDAPISEKAFFMSARIERENLKLYQDAIGSFESFVRRYPSSSMSDDALYFISRIYTDNLDDSSRADEYLKKIIDNYPDGDFAGIAKKEIGAGTIVVKENIETKKNEIWELNKKEHLDDIKVLKDIDYDEEKELENIPSRNMKEIDDLEKSFSTILNKPDEASDAPPPEILKKTTETETIKKPVTKQRTNEVFLDADKVSLEDFINLVSRFLNVNFIYSDTLKGTVNILNPTAFNEHTLLTILKTILKEKGYAVIKKEYGNEILPIDSVRDEDIDVFIGIDAESLPTDDRVITWIYNLKHFSVTDLEKTLTPILDPKSEVVYLPDGNSVMITYFASGLKRIIKIIETLDRPNLSADIFVFPLKNASADDVRNELLNIMKALWKADESPITMFSDKRTNTIFAIGKSDRVKYIESIIKNLDTRIENDKGEGDRFIVIPLNYTAATDVAEVLNKIDLITPNNKTQIIPDNRFQAILVSGTEKSINNIKTIVQFLDRAPYTVNLMMRIVEISSDKRKLMDLPAPRGAVSNEGIDGPYFYTVSEDKTIGSLHIFKSDGDANILSEGMLKALINNKVHLGGKDVFRLDNDNIKHSGSIRHNKNLYESGIDVFITPRSAGVSGTNLDLEQELNILMSYSKRSGPVFSHKTSRNQSLLENNNTLIIEWVLSREKYVKANTFLSKLPFVGLIFGQSIRDTSRSHLLILINQESDSH